MKTEMSFRYLIALAVIPLLAAGADSTVVVKNVVVYHEPGRYGGWPANHGIWSWGNEILVGFSAAYFKIQSPDRHQYDRDKPEEPRLARSLDGGKTWTIEAPKSLLPPEQGGLAVTDLGNPMDFDDPNFAMTIRFADSNVGPSRLWYSTDRGKLWRGPYRFPNVVPQGIAARTDYLINSRRGALVFLTASKKNGKEGRVVCARTTDGGLHWRLVSFIRAGAAGLLHHAVHRQAFFVQTGNRCPSERAARSYLDRFIRKRNKCGNLALAYSSRRFNRRPRR